MAAVKGGITMDLTNVANCNAIINYAKIKLTLRISTRYWLM